MNPFSHEQLAKMLLTGELTPEQFVRGVDAIRSAVLDEATVDLDRMRRCGFPEVIFAQGKSVATFVKIAQRLLAEGIDLLATRVSPEQATALGAEVIGVEYNSVARTLRASSGKACSSKRIERGQVAVITAGSSDLPVAEEARETLEWMKVGARMIHDVGVAGPHRLPARLSELQGLDAVVVVAGMEGALPSVVGGYVDCPVIGVPTSVGYGANFAGISALLSMLNSCASNVTVVNIDAGFKGGYVAGMIATRCHAAREGKIDRPA